MCSRLPLVDPEKIAVPTIVLRGEYDGIAGFEDLTRFFEKLPNADKQFSVMAGISHASFQQKNYMLVYYLLANFFAQPEPRYRGERSEARRVGKEGVSTCRSRWWTDH